MKTRESFVRLDWEASQAIGGGIVVDRSGQLVTRFDTVDDAIRFVAKRNGETEADAIQTTKRFSEYLDNVRRRRKTSKS